MGELSGSCRVWQQWRLHSDAGAGVGAAVTAMARMEMMRIEERIVVFNDCEELCCVVVRDLVVVGIDLSMAEGRELYSKNCMRIE